MTASNGGPGNPESLHYINPRTGENAYTTAIRTVGDILQDYDYDKKIMGLGFGSKIGGVVSQCFPLNGNARNPYCKGVDGLVDSYMDTLKSVTLAEPTCYSKVLQYAVDDAIRSSSEVEYTVILLITDGGVTDFVETKQVLVQMSKQPISVVLVGVGKGDMGALVQLDSDRARLSWGEVQAERDIVQFVEMNKYIPGGVLDPAKYHHELEPPEARLKLARAVLQEIPRQVTEYMRKNGISPRVPDIPDDFQEDFDKKFNI